LAIFLLKKKNRKGRKQEAKIQNTFGLKERALSGRGGER